MGNSKPDELGGIRAGSLYYDVADSDNEGYQRRFVKRYRTEIAASMSSVLSTLGAVRYPLSGYGRLDTDGVNKFPLDSVKTRMQTYKYDSFADCVRQTYKTEGARGFFRGVTAPLLSVTMVRTISFSVYQRSKYTYSAWFKRNLGVDPLAHVNTIGNYPNLSTVACFGAAGATAGSFITVVACESAKLLTPCSADIT